MILWHLYNKVNSLSKFCINDLVFIKYNCKMKVSLKKIAIILFLFILFLPGKAQAQLDQKFEVYSRLLSPEKLYLHINKDTYAAGDTIWFKAYLNNSSEISEFPQSNYIYVELIGYQWVKDPFSLRTNEESQIVDRVKVKRRDGILQGYIKIPDDINSGKGILRAFTYWGLNFDTEYIFNRNIEIINPAKDSYLKDLIDSNIRDREKYTEVGLKYPFDNKKVVAKFDCQFLPESGRLISDKEGVVAFKAVAENGLGIKVEGEVKDLAGNLITTFESDDYGFGKFRLNSSSSDRLIATVRDNRGGEIDFDLPRAQENGINISLNRAGKNIISKVSYSSTIDISKLNFILHDASSILYNQPLEKVIQISIPTERLPKGIINAAVIDNQGNVYASRAFFVMPTPQNISIVTDKTLYRKRDKVSLAISLTDEKEVPLDGDFSIAITDNNLSPYSGKENNIISYMLLSSEIKGYIQEPQRFFDSSRPLRQREEEIDLLLLTQGWKYYDTQAILQGNNKMPIYGREYIQTVSGSVKARKNRPSYVSFVAPSIGFSAMGQLDSSGFFELKDVDFPDSTLFIINAVGVRGGGKQFIPYINEDSFAPLLNYYRNTDTIAGGARLRNSLLESLYQSGDIPAYQLNTVYIKSNRKFSKNDPSPFSNMGFRGDQLREGKDLEPFQNYDLITYVYETCQGLRVDIDSITGDKILKCKVPRVASEFGISDGWEEIVVFVNGSQAFSSSELQNYNVSDIVSILYLKGSEAAPYVPMMTGSASVRSVVMIKTKINAKTGMPRNVAKGYPLGWQRPMKYYTPRYDVPASVRIRQGADLRSSIYWNPSLEIKEGKGEVNFYTSDSNADYTVVIEGISSNGEYVFKSQQIKR